jgi:lycopene cyclase domain-containing protein
MTWISPYLFLELALLVFLVGFGWEQWRLRDLFSGWFWRVALGLASFAFVMDQAAIRLGVWAFPEGSNFSPKLFSMPIEEYVMFFVHTTICFIFVRHYSEEE